MFVATPIIIDTHNVVTVGIIVRGWENFVTAKSTMKTTKISTPLKLLNLQFIVTVHVDFLKFQISYCIQQLYGTLAPPP